MDGLGELELSLEISPAELADCHTYIFCVQNLAESNRSGVCWKTRQISSLSEWRLLEDNLQRDACGDTRHNMVSLCIGISREDLSPDYTMDPNMFPETLRSASQSHLEAISFCRTSRNPHYGLNLAPPLIDTLENSIKTLRFLDIEDAAPWGSAFQLSITAFDNLTLRLKRFEGLRVLAISLPYEGNVANNLRNRPPPAAFPQLHSLSLQSIMNGSFSPPWLFWIRRWEYLYCLSSFSKARAAISTRPSSGNLDNNSNSYDLIRLQTTPGQS
jgi:hypothetical protein